MSDTDTVDEVEIDAELAEKLRDAQQAYDEVAEYLEGLKDELKERYADREKVIGTYGGEQVFTCTRVKATRLNTTRLKREWPDIYAQYAKTTTSQRLAVIRPKAAS